MFIRRPSFRRTLPNLQARCGTRQSRGETPPTFASRRQPEGVHSGVISQTRRSNLATEKNANVCLLCVHVIYLCSWNMDSIWSDRHI